MTKPRIGFVGLGTMGLPMAQRLSEADYQLMVYNRTAAKAAEFAQRNRGVRATVELEQIAQWSNIIITMLPDSADVAHVIFSASEGMLPSIHPRTLVIDMSSILPRVTEVIAAGLAAKKAEFLDAPVSGSPQGATEGTLAIMVGGAQETFERALPILEVLGKTVMRVGEHGAGQVAKLGNQVMVATNLLGMAHAIVQAERAEQDPRLAVSVWSGGLAASTVMTRKAEMMLTRTFTPAQFKLRLHLKDLRNALEDARGRNATPTDIAVLKQLRAVFGTAVDQGLGDQDHSAIIKIFE